MKKFVLLLVIAVVAVTSSLLGVLGTAAAASTAETIVHSGYGAGYNHFYTPTGGTTDVIGAGQFRLKTNDGAELVAFCLVRSKQYNKGTFTPSNPTALSVANAGKIVDVAANSMSIGTPLSSPNDEAAATQLAIWNLSEGDPLTGSNVTNGDLRVVNRAKELVSLAISREVPTLSGGSLSMTVKAAADNKIDVILTVKDPAGAAVSGQSVQLQGVSTQKTGADGTTTFAAVPRPASGSLTANWTAQVLPGTMWAGSTSAAQPIVTTSGFTFSRSLTLPIPQSTGIGATPGSGNVGGPGTPGNGSIDTNIQAPDAPGTVIAITPGSGSTGVPIAPGGGSTDIDLNPLDGSTNIDLNPLNPDSTIVQTTIPQTDDDFSGRLAPAPPSQYQFGPNLDASKPQDASTLLYGLGTLAVLVVLFVVHRLRKAQR